MNNGNIFGLVIIYLESAIIYFICYFLASKICSSVKYKNAKRGYLKILVASIICFLTFLIYGLLDNYFDIEIKFLTPIWFLLFPLSSCLIIVFGFLFFYSKNKGPNKNGGR